MHCSESPWLYGWARRASSAWDLCKERRVTWNREAQALVVLLQAQAQAVVVPAVGPGSAVLLACPGASSLLCSVKQSRPARPAGHWLKALSEAAYRASEQGVIRGCLKLSPGKPCCDENEEFQLCCAC